MAQAPPNGLAAIKQAAASRGLAWQPLAAVAHFESGLSPTAIGDNGHAFGLFQNNNAGGTITGDPNPRRFLNPNVSANYTADAIKRLGIQGLAPAQQVAAIVSRYERPANPGREIAGAQQYLAQLGTGGATTLAVAPPSAPVEGSGTIAPQSLAPLQAGFGLAQASGQRALDALGKLSGHSVQAPAAPNLAALTTSSSASLQPTRSAGLKVPLQGKTPNGIPAQAAKAIELAKHYLGTKYVFGGASPKTGFDCSGLLQYVWGQNGVKIPRTAAEQYHAGKPVTGPLQPGDALYFSENGTIGHTGMYLGGGQFIEAPHTGDVIKIVPLAGHYQSILAGARRFA